MEYIKENIEISRLTDVNSATWVRIHIALITVQVGQS